MSDSSQVRMIDFWNYVIGAAVLCFIGGVALGYNLPHRNHLKSYPAEYFDPSNKPGTIFKTYIPDMDVIVHFKPQAEINADEGMKWSLYAYTTVAQSSKSGVCEINMPSGKGILGVVNDKTSNGEYFTQEYFPQAFAHELLHCIRGTFTNKKPG